MKDTPSPHPHWPSTAGREPCFEKMAGAFLRWSPQKGFSSDGERSDIYLDAEKEVSCLILEYFLRVCYLEGVGMRLSFFGEFYLKVRFTLF